MKILSSIPASHGFFMPGEFEPHAGTILIWPERPGSWAYGAQAARRVFAEIAAEIAKSEKVYILASPRSADSARDALPVNVEVLTVDSDDAWARDTAPTFVRNGDGLVRAVNWRFNAWGGDVDGLYSPWDKDDALALELCKLLEYDAYDAAPFVLEGGSIHCDGEGTLITTEACLLSRGRNPDMSKAAIEGKLKAYLGISKVIWLPNGILGDETNEHVDNACAFIRPGEVVLAWTDDENDPQYACCRACLAVLARERDAKGRELVVHKLPLPDYPVRVTEKDLEGLTFAPGEDRREAGERLAASYVNFYFSNDAVLVPQFGGENAASDQRAIKILAALCPKRRVVPIYSRDLILGGGNIHCITQQIPKGGIGL